MEGVRRAGRAAWAAWAGSGGTASHPSGFQKEGERERERKKKPRAAPHLLDKVGAAVVERCAGQVAKAEGDEIKAIAEPLARVAE